MESDFPFYSLQAQSSFPAVRLRAMQLGSDHTLKIHDTDPDVNTGNSPSIILNPGDGSVAASITLSGSEVITASNAPVLLDPTFVPRRPNEAFLLEGDLSVGNIPAEGVGQRMMWYPGKAAFRAGGLSTYAFDYWDEGNTGQFSIAMGRDVLADGDASVALGSGSGAFGEGSLAAANGIAVGYLSVALAGWNYAYGERSVALASGSTTEWSAYGGVALAGGYAVGNSAVATGGSTAEGDSSVALNSSGAIGDDSTSMGWAGALGSLSVAMGKTEASSYTAVALGQFNEDRVGLDAGVSWQGTEDYSVFEVGIGDDENAKANALTVLQDGSVEVGKATNDADPARRDDVPLTIKSDGSVILAKPQGDISMGVFGD